MASSSQPNGSHQQQIDDLLVTQKLLRATLDSSMDMIQVFEAVRNEQGEIIDFTWILNNHTSEKIYGDVVGKRLLQHQPGVVKEGIFEAFKQVVETGLPQQYEKQYVHEQFDGWFHQSAVKLNDGVATTTADITSRKKAELELQQSKELLQDIIDAPAIGIVVYRAVRDKKGQIIDFVHEYINRASIDMLGSEDFTGKLFTDHGENGRLQLPQLIEVIETGRNNEYIREAVFRGQKVWFAITNTPLDSERLVHTWEDVTERKTAELALNEQAYFIRSITDAAPAIISITTHPGGEAVFNNRDTFTTLGFDADELVKLKREDRLMLVHPQDRPKFKDYYGWFDNPTNEEEARIDYRLKNKSGEWVWIDTRGKIFKRDADGNVSHVLHIAQDITPQKKAEQERRAQAQFISQITEIVPDIINVIELPSRKLVWSNVEPYALFGFNREQILNMTVEERHDLIHPEDYPKLSGFYESFSASTTDEEIHSATYRVRTNLGEWITAYIRGKVFERNEDGSVRTILATAQNITEKEKAQQEILRLKDEVAQKATDKYYSIFNSIDEGFCIQELIYDGNGKLVDLRITEANPAYERQTGLTKDVIGRLHSELGLATESYWFDVYDRIAKTGEPETFENWHEPTGRWYHASISRIGEEDSRELAVVFNDITERKRHEQQQELFLKLSDILRTQFSDTALIQEAALKLVAEQFDVMRAVYYEGEPDEDTFTLTASFGREAMPIPVQLRLSDFPPTVAEEYRTGRTQIITDTENEPLREAYRVIGPGAWLAVPFVQEGRLVTVIGVHSKTPRNWTTAEIQLLEHFAERTWTAVERAKAEEALHESKKRFESIANLVPDLLWDSEPDGSTNWYNQRWLDYTGQRFEEAIGWGWTDAIHPDDRDASARRYGEAVEAGKFLRQEHRIRRHDGAYRWFVVSASPLKDETGQVVNIYGAATDIHDHKRLEATLLEADRRKDEFLAMLAHELRNPLAPVRNGLQLLAQTHAEDQIMSTMLPIMNRQMEHLMRMVDDLLDVSRISRGKIELHKQRIDLTQVVSQAVQAMQLLYTASGRQLNAQLPGYSLYLDGDATRLNQVVVNLLSNGLRYTHEGGQVWLSLEQLSGQAVLRVRDNGIGLAADQLNAIFDLFVQVDTSLARSNGGLGLGLALVQQLVQLHGGRVEAHSPGLGHGSEFVVYMPILIV